MRMNAEQQSPLAPPAMTGAIAKEAAKTAGAEERFVTLNIDREIFAIPVDGVHEILDMQPYSHPGGARLHDGAHRLARPQRARARPARQARPAVHSRHANHPHPGAGGRRSRPLVLGLVADRVIEVLSFSAGEMKPAPEIGVRWRSEYISGVGHRDASFVIIFNLAKLFRDEEALALTGACLAGPAACRSRRAYSFGR